ncbi:MAG: M48 family metalloprotease [Heteroscytonema crispum UTEX LB 1556]
MPSHAESSLEAGLFALKQGDYQKAIAQLQLVANSQGNDSIGLQAKVGIVMAYARSGKISKAIALCQTLTQVDTPQVRDWAERALQQLTNHQKNAIAKKTETGFVPFENSSQSSQSSQSINSATISSKQKPQDTPRQTAENNVATAPSSPDTSYPPTIQGSGVFGSVSREQVKSPPIYWRHAGRAKVWQPIHKYNILPLRLLAAGTFIALFWVMREMLKLAMGLINDILYKLPFLEPLQFLYSDPTQLLLLVLVILTGVSPWLLDWLLANFYGQRHLPKENLNMHSRESVRVLQRYCQQRGWQLPKLRVLPIAAPMALTYGNHPRNARIVVSQGLLEQLADDEIAAIYAGQLGHITHWDVVVMSLVLVVTLFVYRLYQLVSEWGDRISNGFLRGVVSIITSFVYGIWCLLSGTALWLSRLRLYYSDRASAETTGNPNGVVRALLKIAIGVARDVEKQEQTSWQLESLNLLTPMSYQQSLTLGSIAGHISFDSFVMWDYLNPHRRWFTINNSHPLIGDRIEHLCKIARHWHLLNEVHVESQKPLKVKPQSFLLQIAPWLGIILGFVFAGLIGLLWHLAYTVKLLNLKWIYNDWSYITGCLLIGFSIATVIRTNPLFPDIKTASVQTDERLPNLLANPTALPIDSIKVRLVGKLLGRQGIANSLAQDLILQSNTGLVKLHHVSCPGQTVNPQDLIGRQITVTGWFRRGATPWIDIQTLQTQNGKTINSPHPIWSTVLAVAAQAWGAYILLRG